MSAAQLKDILEEHVDDASKALKAELITSALRVYKSRTDELPGHVIDAFDISYHQHVHL